VSEPWTFTQLLLKHFLADPDMPETVRQWHQAEPDPERRAMLFACAMSEDVIAAFRTDSESPDAVLRAALLRMVVDRVAWRRVVDELLRHFTQPIYLACLTTNSIVGNGCTRPRWSPAVGAGSNN
jgi:hypothetical protein